MPYPNPGIYLRIKTVPDYTHAQFDLELIPPGSEGTVVASRRHPADQSYMCLIYFDKFGTRAVQRKYTIATGRTNDRGCR